MNEIAEPQPIHCNETPACRQRFCTCECLGCYTAVRIMAHCRREPECAMHSVYGYGKRPERCVCICASCTVDRNRIITLMSVSGVILARELTPYEKSCLEYRSPAEIARAGRPQCNKMAEAIIHEGGATSQSCCVLHEGHELEPGNELCIRAHDGSRFKSNADSIKK
jgi:hypothetical protein